MNQRVAGSIPSQGTCLVAGQVPSWGHARGNHALMFFSLSFSLPSLLSKNKIKSLKKKKRKRKPYTKHHIAYDSTYMKCPE